MLQMPSRLIAAWRLALLTANSLMESFLHPTSHPHHSVLQQTHYISKPLESPVNGRLCQFLIFPSYLKRSRKSNGSVSRKRLWKWRMIAGKGDGLASDQSDQSDHREEWLWDVRESGGS